MKTALGWALIHFLWQGSLLAGLMLAARAAFRLRSPRARYALACATLLAMAACLPATLAVLWPEGQVSAGLHYVNPAPPPEAGGGNAPFSPGWRGGVEAALPYLVLIWAAGVALFTLRAAGGWLLVWRSARQATAPADAVVREAYARVAAALGLRRAAHVAVSAAARTPQVVGWLRPVILFPAAALAGLTPRQLEMVLAHELAHIARHDFLINLVQTAVEALLFYHPAVWWLSREIRQQRERCCDDTAVALCGDRVEYSRVLLRLEEQRAALAVAATGGGLKARIERLLGVPVAEETPRPVWAALAVALLLGGAWFVRAQEQTPAPPPPPAPSAPAVSKQPTAEEDLDALRSRLHHVLESRAAAAAKLQQDIKALEQSHQASGVQTERQRADAEQALRAQQLLLQRIDEQLQAATAAFEQAAQRHSRDLERTLSGIKRERLEVEKREAEVRLRALLSRERRDASERGAREELAAQQQRVAELKRSLERAVAELEAQRKTAAPDKPEELRTLQQELDPRRWDLVAEEAQIKKLRQETQMIRLRAELQSPYFKWLNEDVVYIIAPEERSAFERLQSDPEREKFIEQFWQRRDPTPGTEKNEFKEEHYRRIAYTNERFALGQPGWRTDRGKAYIVFGPPDEIESHPSGPREAWLWRGADKKSVLRLLRFSGDQYKLEGPWPEK